MKQIGVALIKVELAPRELIMFNTLYEAGVFNIRNGTAVLNFDSEGTLTQIDTKIVSYKRGKPLINSLTNEKVV